MLVGVWALGHKVIKTIGKDLTDVNAASGFAMALGSAFTILLASKASIPVSTTHCIVGAVIFVGVLSTFFCKTFIQKGIARNGDTSAVKWRLFGNIAIAWLITVPVAGLISAGVTAALAQIVFHYY